MVPPVYLLLGAIFLLVALGRVVVRVGPKGPDWALEVAFIRLEFPPEQRSVAQQLAAGLAEIVGMRIKQLKPEHSLAEIAKWAEDGIHAKDLITLFVVAFNVKCDSATTFRDLVQKVAERKANGAREALKSSHEPVDTRAVMEIPTFDEGPVVTNFSSYTGPCSSTAGMRSRSANTITIFRRFYGADN